MFCDLPAEQVSRAVEAVAAELLSETDISKPPVDAILLARRLGMVLVRAGRAKTRARMVRLSAETGRPSAILLADEPRLERKQWAVAHEIGEFAAARAFAALGVDPGHGVVSAREHVANRLANCLLLPGDWFRADGAACEWDLPQLKGIYRSASHELIARRMLDLGPPVVITLFDQGRPRWRRSNCFGCPPSITKCEWAVWRLTHESSRLSMSDQPRLPRGVDDVRAWPVHEPPWKREILRTAIAEFW